MCGNLNVTCVENRHRLEDLRTSSSTTTYDEHRMADDDVWAQMGLPMGFGKQTVKKTVDVAARMSKQRRDVDEVRL